MRKNFQRFKARRERRFALPSSRLAIALICGAAVLPSDAQAQGTPAKLNQALSAYDAAITAGSTPAVATLTNAVTLDGTAGAPFDFGATFGDATMEFILQGDPTVGPNGYLAVGENSTSSLRYAQWQNTQQMGFTQAGVADYLFSPAVPSPTAPSHVTYVWNSIDLTLGLYVNGVLASTATGVTPDFGLPTGPGFLGSTLGGTELMTGTIYRVTVYSGVLAETDIKAHANAFADVALPRINSFAATPPEIDPSAPATLSWSVTNATTVFLNNAVVTGTNQIVTPAVTTSYTLIASNEVAVTTQTLRVFVNPRLDLYDAAIAAGQTNGLTPVTLLTNTVNLTGAGGEPFDFGATSGSTTMEFILEGDPAAGPDAFLAVGEIANSSLRYAQWQNTRQMGFTQGGVADYLFAPGVPSPTIATHVAYAWNADNTTMKIYLNGVLSGTITNVSPEFALPSGAGFLGANLAGGEAMTGRIFRLAVYPGELPAATVQEHATAFTSVLRPPIISSFTATPNEILGQGSSSLQWAVQDATAVFLNGTDVTGVTNTTVTPVSSTSYTLLASNAISTVTAKVTVSVTPILTNYDAVIAADTTAGLAPVAILTNAVTLSGSGGVPFDFGPTFGDTSIEFILEGDPTAGPNAYLAVGENTTSNLRYAQWENTRLMGFTQLGVADYLFTPDVASPVRPTHVVFVWNSAELVMSVYTNGTLAASVTGVSPDFAMPSGAGVLGATVAGGEAMTGRIFRVVVYSGVLPETTIQKHSAAFGAAPTPPQGEASLGIAVNAGNAAITLTGVAGTHYRVEYRDAIAGAGAWQLLQDIPSLTGTTVQVADPAPVTGVARRFYRAVTVP